VFPYRIEITTTAVKQLKRIPEPDNRRIRQRIDDLAADPRPPGAVKLSGMQDAWRVRQGNYRIVYSIDDAITVVTVTRVAQRGEVYR
jgi:mRNA interferase RelE/StbE